MDLISIGILTDIATVVFTVIAALIGIKLGINGLKKDTRNTAVDVNEIKLSLREAATQRADLDRRLAYVEGELGQIGHTLTRMGGL